MNPCCSIQKWLPICKLLDWKPIQALGSDDFLLDAYFPASHHDAPLFPSSDADAARSPLTKRAYDPALHLAIGNLKQFDATKNGAPGTVPYSDWSAPNGEIIRGGSLLDVHGQMFFAVLSVVTPKLIPELGEAIGAVNNADDIKSVMQRHVRWCA